MNGMTKKRMSAITIMGKRTTAAILLLAPIAVMAQAPQGGLDPATLLIPTCTT